MPKKKNKDEEASDWHTTSVKLNRGQYLSVCEIAFKKAVSQTRGAPNIGEVIREAVTMYIMAYKRGDTK